MKLTSKNIVDTQKIAQILVEKILNTEANKSAVVVALEGELGAGKTTFVKGLAVSLITLVIIFIYWAFFLYKAWSSKKKGL